MSYIPKGSTNHSLASNGYSNRANVLAAIFVEE
jgi:hypothetical protein